MILRDRCKAIRGVVVLPLFVAAGAFAEDWGQVPGTVIAHVPARTGIYIGSPGLAVLPGGDYVATHDEFGPESSSRTSAITRVYRSADKGRTWTGIARIDGAFWSTLFTHRGDLYLIGCTSEYGRLVIRRSTDGGRSWTTPKDAHSGLLGEGRYHCAPVPVIEHAGRLWRGMEDAEGPGGWGSRFRALMLSVPVEADLLDAGNWTFSNRVPRDRRWLDGRFGGWLEGNVVVTPEGGIVDILRVDVKPQGATAAMVHVSPDGKRAEFDPNRDFIAFPGGAKKFTIRFDPQSRRYWSLTNPVLPQHAGPDPSRIRNALALVSSSDLRNWEIRCVVLYHPDTERHGFQYVDWLFDGDDLIAACRTAYDDGEGGAHNMHDANFLTFHRIRHFRRLKMTDSVEGAVRPASAPAGNGR